MDDHNIIDLSTDVDDLEEEMDKYLSLPFRLKKQADDACLTKYGYTNPELFNRLKAAIIKHEDIPEDNSNIPTPVNEDDNNDATADTIKYTIPDYGGISGEKTTQDFNMISMYDRIHAAEALEQNDPNIIIINDFLDDGNPDYDITQLVLKYDKFLLLPQQYKEYSNSHSIAIWGKDVPTMFIYMKTKIDSNNAVIESSLVDKELNEYKHEIQLSKESGDYLESLIRKADCLVGADSIYETGVLESLANDIVPSEFDYSTDVPGVTPFMTPDEYSDYNDRAEIDNPFQYIFIENPKDYYSTIQKLQTNLSEDNIKQIIKFGWNPYVRICGESLKYAREKQIKWLNLHEQIHVIDLHKYSTDLDIPTYNSVNEIMEASDEEAALLEPVYIVLSFHGGPFGQLVTSWTKSSYSHACLSLDTSLTKLYTYGHSMFNGKVYYGFSIENVKDYTNPATGDCNLCVMGLFITKEAMNNLKSNIDYFNNHRNQTHYAVEDIGKILLKKADNSPYSLNMICSQFVDAMLKSIGLDFTHKASNLVTPEDFTKINQNANVYMLFQGLRSKYNAKSIDKHITALKKQLSFNQLDVYSSTNVVNQLRSFKIEAFNITCNNPKVNEVLKEIRSYIKPVAVITERKYIGFNDKGDLIITKPEDLEKEYQEAHRLLSNYDETNLEGIKHELAHLFYLNELIEKKLDKVDKKKEPETYKKLIDLRARVLNDFTTYFKIVKAADPKFDFAAYMRTTEYYDKTIEVDHTTLKYIGGIIKLFLKKIPSNKN